MCTPTQTQNFLPCVVDSTLRRRGFSLHCWTVLYYWRLLVHKRSRCTRPWKKHQNNEVSENHRASSSKYQTTSSIDRRGLRRGGLDTHRHLLNRNCKPGKETYFKLFLLSYHINKKRAFCEEDRPTWDLLKVMYCWINKLPEVLESIITTGEVKDKSNTWWAHTKQESKWCCWWWRHTKAA